MTEKVSVSKGSIAKYRSSIAFNMSNWNIWAFPFLVVVVILVSGSMVLKPAIETILQSRDEIEVKRKELDEVISQRLFLETLSEPQLQRDLRAVESVLYSYKPVYEFMATLALLADEHQITIGEYDMSPGSIATESSEIVDTSEPGELDQIDVEVVLNGTHESVLAFMNDTSYISPMLTIQSMTLNDSRYQLVSEMESDLVNTSERNEEVSINALFSVNYSLRPDLSTSNRGLSDFSDLSESERQLIQKIYSFKQYEVEEQPPSLPENRESIFDY